MVTLKDETYPDDLGGGGRSAVAPEVPATTVRMYGDDDDHLRAIVLLSISLGESDQAAARQCQKPLNNPWHQRLGAFRELLRASARKGRLPPLRLEDPDALAGGPSNDRRRWDDARFAHQHREFLDLLLRAALDDGLLVLVRTQPQRRVDYRIQDAVIREGNLDRVESSEPVECVSGIALSKVLAPVARWLLAQGVMAEVDLRALDEIHGTRDLLIAAWERFKPSVRRDAMRLCTVREPMHRNGAMGPFSWARTPSAGLAPSVSTASVDELAAAGFLQTAPDRHCLSMPRGIRHFVERHARLLEPESTRLLHTVHAAAIEREGDTPARVMEAHWHAIAAQDAERAFRTARYYGADLRSVAIQLGRSAHRIRRQGHPSEACSAFEKAASIFERIVSEFDPEDAYAWEYAAYNRWQIHRTASTAMPPSRRDLIRQGFEQASRLDAKNPLFRGRLIAFQIECDERIGAEIDRWMHTFSTLFGNRDRSAAERLTWFAEPVLGALHRRRQDAEVERLMSTWPILHEVQARILERRKGLSDLDGLD